MAKLEIREFFEGTNEEIKALEKTLVEIARNKSYGKEIADTVVKVVYKAEYDVVLPHEETLSERLTRELEVLRPVLSRSAIRKANQLIEEARQAEEDECYCDECNEDYDDEDYDDEDDCDCGCEDDDESQQGIVIRIVVL